jgi:hypothetical protein
MWIGNGAYPERETQKMSKGTAITLKLGASNEDAAKAVFKKYEDKITSQKGWYGSAVVNIGEKDEEGYRVVLVKAVEGGFKVFEEASFIPLKLKATIG